MQIVLRSDYGNSPGQLSSLAYEDIRRNRSYKQFCFTLRSKWDGKFSTYIWRRVQQVYNCFIGWNMNYLNYQKQETHKPYRSNESQWHKFKIFVVHMHLIPLYGPNLLFKFIIFIIWICIMRVWLVSRGCLPLLGTWSYLRICRRSVLPYTRFCNCLLDYDFVLHIVNFAILYQKAAIQVWHFSCSVDLEENILKEFSDKMARFF
jgi:hypothetical protein